MKKKSFFVLFTVASCLLAGCSELTMDNFKKSKLKPEMFFDFNTTVRVNVDLDYGEYGAYTLVSIFADDPADSADQGNTRPLFKVFTDKKGQVLSSFDMPDSIQDSVYLYTSAIGTPQIVKAAITDSTIRYKYERIQYSTEDFRTRVIDYPYFGYDEGNLHSILNWYGQYHGRVGDHNQLITSSCMVPADKLPSITKAFWNGSSSRPASLDNSDSVTDSDINIETTKDGVKVYFTFLTENTEHLNAIGYYFYPKDNCPKDFATMHKYVIFPNTSVGGSTPYNGFGIMGKYWENDAPVAKMTTVQLLYVNITGDGAYTFSEYFPKDLVIGFFMIKDSWTPAWSDAFKTGGNGFLYTDKAANVDSKAHFIRKDASGYIVYGAEYGDNLSYDDIMFTMQASPSDGISYSSEKIPDVPATPDPGQPDDSGDDNPDFTSANEIYRTYCFEDLWPVKGDYDMNDVVIDHCSRIKSDIYNYVTEIVDEFTVCNRYMSAQVADAFAVIIPESQRGSMTLPQGAVDEKETGAIILFGDVQEHLGQTVQIVRNLSGKKISCSSIITDLDPFIIPRVDFDDFLRDNRREVHMAKKEGTKKLDASLLGMAQEAYFVDKDGKHPFAITIPLSAKNGEYIIPEEMRQIDTEYEDFGKWVNSSGYYYKNWYNNYRYAK